ncbi:MAG TPA: hypothetical protein VFS96_03105 [Nitrolancea sp.]|nr:hypothetical protein [Nitrolancea sp.]
MGLNKQLLTPTRLIAQSTASLLIVVFTVIGLLNIPTECACGSSVPHPHSLFMMSHHHHDDGHMDTGHADDVNLHAANIVGVSGDSSPVIRNLTTSFSSEQPFASPSGILHWGLGNAITWDLLFNLPALLGQVTPPEPPPPRPQG